MLPVSSRTTKGLSICLSLGLCLSLPPDGDQVIDVHEMAYFQRAPYSGPGMKVEGKDDCDGVILRHEGQEGQTCDVLVLAGEPLRGGASQRNESHRL